MQRKVLVERGARFRCVIRCAHRKGAPDGKPTSNAESWESRSALATRHQRQPYRLFPRQANQRRHRETDRGDGTRPRIRRDGEALGVPTEILRPVMNWHPIRGWTKPLHERGTKADSMPERLLIGPGSPPSIDPVYPELSPPPEPCLRERGKGSPIPFVQGAAQGGPAFPGVGLALPSHGWLKCGRRDAASCRSRNCQCLQ